MHTAAASIITIFFMNLFRNSIREAYLMPYINEYGPDVATQFGPAILFFLIFAIGIALIAYLIRLALKAGMEVEA